MTDLNSQPADNPYLRRQIRLAQDLAGSSMEIIALNPGPTLEYLTGLKFHLSERPVIALFAPGAPVQIFHPELESAKLANLSFPARVLPMGKIPIHGCPSSSTDSSKLAYATRPRLASSRANYAYLSIHSCKAPHLRHNSSLLERL